MGRIAANGIEIEYDTFGDRAAPPMVLIMGFGMQLTMWEPKFCTALAARGFQVIRFDNRDVGLSTHLDDAPLPNLLAALSGLPLGEVPYTLSDMASDTVALLDGLGFEAAHIVGASMGGMIAQCVAIEHPTRMRSLTSIMSSTGDRRVGEPTPAAWKVLTTPAPTERAAYLDYEVMLWRTIGSTGFPFHEDALRERMGAAFDRAFYPPGAARQFGAILSASDRTEALGGVKVPSLVIHGEVDPLIQLSGGKATAQAIPGCDLVTIPGMGHDLPEGAWPSIIDAIARTAQRAR